MTRLEELATAAATAIATTNIPAIANQIESEIDSYRPINPGEHLVIIAAGHPLGYGPNNIELHPDGNNLESFFIAWGTPEEIAMRMYKSGIIRFDGLATGTDAECMKAIEAGVNSYATATFFERY